MKIGLKEDFYDYYDHHFENRYAPIVLNRMSDSGMSRPEMFTFFTKNKIKTPNYGKVCELSHKGHCVVYKDIRAHRGDGKELLSIKDAMIYHPDLFASEYIDNYSISYRYLVIGNLFYWLKYKSFSDWRSNCGDVIIEIITYQDHSMFPTISLDIPLYAIDFVENKNILYAIDFNIAPQIRGTGLEEILPAKDIYNAIRNFIINHVQ